MNKLIRWKFMVFSILVEPIGTTKWKTYVNLNTSNELKVALDKRDKNEIWFQFQTWLFTFRLNFILV